MASPIMVQHISRQVRKLRRNRLVEQSPVRASPSVYALLHISHNKIITALRLAVMQQRAEVGPMDCSRILKLVKKKMIEADSHLLVYKRSIRPINYIP